MWKKLLSSTLALAVGFSSIIMIGVNSANAASEVVNTPPSTNITSPPIVINSADQTQVEKETRGMKGFFVKLAIKTIKTAIDKGGDVLNFIMKWLDKGTANYVKKNKNKIVKSLDQLEDWIDDASDLTQSTIKTKLNSLLRAAGVPAKYSLSIADAIARTITWLVM